MYDSAKAKMLFFETFWPLRLYNVKKTDVLDFNKSHLWTLVSHQGSGKKIIGKSIRKEDKNEPNETEIKLSYAISNDK